MLNGDEVDDAAMSADKAEKLFKTRSRSFFDECSQSMQEGVLEEQELQMEVEFRSSHSIDFKFYVSELALKYNNSNVAEAFDITLRQVKEWRRQNLLLKQAYYEKHVAVKTNKDKVTPDFNFSEATAATANVPAANSERDSTPKSTTSPSSFFYSQPTMSATVNSSLTPKPRKKSSYSSEYKLKAVAYAEMTTNRAAAREFNVHEKRIREWRKNKEILMNSPKDCRRLKGAGRKPAVNLQLEESLYNWLILTAKGRHSVSKTDLQAKAIELSLKSPQQGKFVASDAWLERFLNRYGLNLKENGNSSSSSGNQSGHSNLSETFPPPTMITEDAQSNPFGTLAINLNTNDSMNVNETTDDSSLSIPYDRT